jgi:hopanoid biosynthesis associated protein HpnK
MDSEIMSRFRLTVSMKRLIVNADDFGFTRGVNAGIARAFQAGIVTGATIMAGGDAFEDAVEVARANPGLAVGCHLTVVGGRPVSAPGRIPSLVSETGRLPRTLGELTLKLARGAISRIDIETELRAQIERVVSAGIAPSHLDTHKHTHIHPAVMRALARVAVEFGIRRVRNPFERFSIPGLLRTAATGRKGQMKQYVTSTAVLPAAFLFRRMARKYGFKTPDRFWGMALTGLIDGPALVRLLTTIEDGTTEIMCHPGIYDEELERAPTRLKQQRQREIEALTDPEVRRCLGDCGIELINYTELA